MTNGQTSEPITIFSTLLAALTTELTESRNTQKDLEKAATTINSLGQFFATDKKTPDGNPHK